MTPTNMRNTLLLLGFAVSLAAIPPSANGSGVSDFDEAVAILAVIEGLECDWQCGLNCSAEDQHDLYASRFGNDYDLDLGEHWCMEFEFGCDAHTCGGGSEEARLLPAQLKEQVSVSRHGSDRPEAAPQCDAGVDGSERPVPGEPKNRPRCVPDDLVLDRIEECATCIDGSGYRELANVSHPGIEYRCRARAEEHDRISGNPNGPCDVRLEFAGSVARTVDHDR